MADLDLDTIRHALETARREGVTELQLEIGASTFAATLAPQKKAPSAVKIELNGAAPDLAAAIPALKSITASCVGFYKPAGTPLSVGSKVTKGDIVASITALGLANDVESPVSGEVVEIIAKPDQPVEYGQVLATVREGD